MNDRDRLESEIVREVLPERFSFILFSGFCHITLSFRNVNDLDGFRKTSQHEL